MSTNSDLRTKNKDDEVVDEGVKISEDLGFSRDSTEANLDDYTYNFLGSIYDLPGFEHFNFYSTDSSTKKDLSKPTIAIIPDTHGDSAVINADQEVVDIKLSPSPKLIEEIFNTSIWRDSDNFSDDFIFAPGRDNIPVSVPDNIQPSPSSLVDRRKTQSSGRRNIFSSIFRSKKGQRKYDDKLPGKDISDNDSLQDTTERKQSIGKNHTDTDRKSSPHDSKKPLNSIFNRDWLNTIGEGVTKKASVMSELRKLFHHGRFKNFRKMSRKNSYDITTETKS